MRKESRPAILSGVKGIVFSEALAAEGAVVFAKACELGLEGVVSKRAMTAAPQKSTGEVGPSMEWGWPLSPVSGQQSG